MIVEFWSKLFCFFVANSINLQQNYLPKYIHRNVTKLAVAYALANGLSFLSIQLYIIYKNYSQTSFLYIVVTLKNA